MLQTSRLISECSTETNGSGSTEQTELSTEDVPDDVSELSNDDALDAVTEIYTKQTSKCRPKQTPRPSAVDSRSDSRERFFKSDDPSIFYFSKNQKKRSSQPGQIKHSENDALMALTSRYELEAALHSIICSEKFKSYFVEEFADTVRLKKCYSNLRRILLMLVVLNVILIISAVSLLPVIFVSFRLDSAHEAPGTHSVDDAVKELVYQTLPSPRAKEIIRRNVFCGNCDLLTDPGSNEECCFQDISTLIKKATGDINEKIKTVSKDVNETRKSIDRMEDAIVGLEAKVYNGSNSARMSRGRFQKTIVYQRVDDNNRLLNKLLHRKRSLIQMIGTGDLLGQMSWTTEAIAGNMITWQKDRIYVKGGGSYLLIVKIQIQRKICSYPGTLEFYIMKQMDDKFAIESPVAYVKKGCIAETTIEEPLTLQKSFTVEQGRNAFVWIQLNSYFLGFVSREIGMHAFSVIEI